MEDKKITIFVVWIVGAVCEQQNCYEETRENVEGTGFSETLEFPLDFPDIGYFCFLAFPSPSSSFPFFFSFASSISRPFD